MLTKKQWEQIIDHSIRNDTFLALNRILFNNEKYEDVIKDLDKNREKYNIKKYTNLVQEKTINKYIELYKQHIEVKKEEEIDINKATGIYGIYIDEELVYIGKTTTSFKTRFNSHKSNLFTSDTYLYRTLRVAKSLGATIELVPLIVVENLKIDKPLKNRDINMMELALIELYQPKCNIQGRLSLYPLQN